MSATWAKGTGRYAGRIYNVIDGEGRLILSLWPGVTIGHGDYARIVRRDGDSLFLPERRVGTVVLDRVTLTHGLTGYWEVGDSKTHVFSADLPSGVLEREVAGLNLEAILGELAPFTTINAARRAVLLVRKEGGRDVAYTADPNGLDGSTERWLANLLCDNPNGKAAITALRHRAIRSATDISYMQGVIGRTIVLDHTASTWMWQNADTSLVPVTDYRLGDEAVNLRDMVASGIAIPLGLNQFSGDMVEVLGLTALSQVAYNGREGDPFKFLVPCEPGEERTIHVVVRHEQGFMVYGFTVARRSDANAEADARDRQENPLTAPRRRPVHFSQRTERSYFVFPGGERIVHVI